MAITAVNLTNDGTTTDAVSFTTASISPTANRLILLAVSCRPATGSAAPTVTGNGLTWVPVGGGEYGGAGARRTVRVWRAMGASPTSGVITLDFGAVTVASINWSVDEFAGVDTSGTNGSGAIVQSAATINATASTSITQTLSAFGSTSNVGYGAVSHALNATLTVGSGFAALCNRSIGTDNISLLTEWLVNDNTVDASWAGSTTRGIVAAEIKAGASDFPLDAQDDAYAITGNTAAVLADRLVSSDPGTHVLTGVLASLILGRLVATDPGVYALTGFDTDLVFTPAGDFSVNAATGAFTITGSSAATVAAHSIDIAPGYYAVTGNLATFESAILPAFPAGEPGYIADYGRGRIREPVEVTA
jgi:hypothetical protein